MLPSSAVVLGDTDNIYLLDHQVKAGSTTHWQVFGARGRPSTVAGIMVERYTIYISFLVLVDKYTPGVVA